MKVKHLILVIAILLVLSLLIISIFPEANPITKIFKSRDNNKCKASEGYSEQEWKDHMSHHPDLYADCL